MATNANQNVQQAVLATGSAVRPSQVPVQLELFDREGNPWNLEDIVSRLDALENASE